MIDPEVLQRENRLLRARISRLSAASLRISATLDLKTVLREVAQSARVLTGARYSAIITIDDAGQLRDFVTSGLSRKRRRQLAAWSDGPRLFEHFRDLSGPQRLADLSAQVATLGLSPGLLPFQAFQGTPMRYRGAHVGNFYLVEKEGGGEFTDEDEEVLVLFASQAAAAISNARTYHAEQRARADLEALVETSPVGVAVFDGTTGNLVSLNREATRIVEDLRMPDRPLEEAIQSITCRRGDGREIALDQSSLARELSNLNAVRAEEIELLAADGRNVKALINVTPIHAENGTIASVVITLQDLAPLEEMERMRVQFLGNGQSRAARTSHLHQGLGRNPAQHAAGVGPGRNSSAIPHH